MGITLVCAKVALIPVVFDYGSDVPFSVSKALLSHALAYVLAGVMVGLFAQYGRTVLVWSRLHIPVLVFLVVNIAATVFAVDHLLALFGAHTRMVGLGTIADCVLLYFAIALLVRTRRDTLALALSFFGGAVVVLAYEFIQLLGKDPLTWAIDPATRPFSTIGQTTSLAEYLSVVAVGAAAAAIFMRGLPAAARTVLILFSGVAIAGTVVTQTRSAVLGLIAAAGLLVALTWAAHPHPRARLVSAIGAAGAGVALAVVLFMTPLGARLLSTVDTAATAEGESGSRLEESADARVALYRIAFEMLRDRPALGHGPDTFLASLPRFRSGAEPYGVQDNPSNSAHSWVAQVGATSGLAGLVAFVATAAIGIVLTFRRGFLPEAWVALAMLVAFLGAGLTTVNAIATDWLFWAAAGAIASSTSHPAPTGASDLAEPPNTRRTKSTKTYPIIRTRSAIAYVCVGIGFVLALTTVSALDASRSVKASQLARLQGQTQRAIDLGLQATRSDPLRPQYWNTLGLAYVSANRLAEAVSAFDRASSLAPYDVRYDGDLARAYAAQFLQGDRTANSRARGVADRVVRTDPNNPRAQHSRTVVMQATGDLPEAVKSSERAVALDRTTEAGYTANPEIYVTGVQVLNAVGRPLDAITLARRAMPILGDEVVRVPLRIELSRALLANGQAAEALTEIDAALSMRPNDPNAQQLRAQIQAALR
jgi:O-antigen ligase/cytochrome c-type biogenesis protein CcmH/NrfG